MERIIFIIVSHKKLLYNFNFRPNPVFIWDIILFWIIYSAYAYTVSWYKVKWLMDQLIIWDKGLKSLLSSPGYILRNNLYNGGLTTLTQKIMF